MNDSPHKSIADAAAEAAGLDHAPDTEEYEADLAETTGVVVPRGRESADLVAWSATINGLLQPYTLNLDAWAEALFDVAEFPDSDPEEDSNALLASILLAETSGQALAAMNTRSARDDLCGGEPGGHSPLLVFYGARALRSTFEEGASCYMLADCEIKATGERIKVTTGARAVQAVVLAHMARGWMPFEAVLTIKAQKTRRGFYPLNLEAGG